MCWQDQTLLSHPCFTSNSCKNYASSKIAFVQGFDDEPGSNVMSFSHHILNWSILTAREHMDLAIWLVTQQARWTNGSAKKVGQFLSVKCAWSEFHDIPFLWSSRMIHLFLHSFDKKNKRQSRTFSLRLLFVSAVRLGAVVVDLGLFVRAESCVFLKWSWCFDKLCRALNGRCGQGLKIASGISQGCIPLWVPIKQHVLCCFVPYSNDNFKVPLTRWIPIQNPCLW